MYNQGYRPPQSPSNPPPGAWYAPGAGAAPGGKAAPRTAAVQPRRAAAKRPASRSGGSSGGQTPPKPKKKHSFKAQLLKLLLMLVLLAAAAYGVHIWKTQSDVRPYTSVFVDNVYVDGINLSGLTWEQGASAVQQQIDDKLSSWYVRLKNSSGEYKDITAQTLGITRDATAALEQAWSVGHEVSTTNRKDIFALKAEIEAAQNTTNEFSSVEQSADTAPIDSILATLEQAAYVAPQDASVISFDPDNNTQPFSFQPEVIGKRLNTESIKSQILQMVETFTSGEVLVQPDDIQPSVTVADLQQQLSLRSRAVTPIASNSTNERNDNIRVAFSKINGLSLDVNAKFSFNKIVGRRTEANGFFPAFEYSYGELTEGIGGGVCQASTTVYLAAMTAGLELTDHTAHSTSVSYTEMGKDATVSDTRGHEVDLQFRNTTGGRVFFSAHVITDPSNSRRLMTEVRVYGLALGNTRYELETELVETLETPTEPEIIQDKNAKYVTYTDEEKVVIKASEGYVYDTYLVTVVDGVQTAREKIARSRYKNRAERIYVGVTERPVE